MLLRKKFCGVKFRDFAGYGITLYVPIHWFKNISLKYCQKMVTLRADGSSF